MRRRYEAEEVLRVTFEAQPGGWPGPSKQAVLAGVDAPSFEVPPVATMAVSTKSPDRPDLHRLFIELSRVVLRRPFSGIGRRRQMRCASMWRITT